jgi:mRNA-degrading endonuclease RelE of RelBE toxin-antitoxin system
LARLVLARRARHDLLDMGWPLIDAIEDALGLLERDPIAGHALRGRLRGLYSLRVGAYRILYQVTDDGKTVRVAAIRRRSISYARSSGSNPARLADG